MDEELVYIRLFCKDCENFDCKIHPIGRWFNTDAELGCTKGISETLAAQYAHINEEIMPFIYINHTDQNTINKTYQELINIEEQIYKAPFGVMFDEKGKSLNIPMKKK